MSSKLKIRLAIVDDDDLARTGLITILKPFSDLDIVFETNNGQDLIDRLKFIPIDVILLDIKMKGMTGIEALKHIREFDTKIKIIMLSMHEQTSYVFRSLEAKANGYMLKKSKAEDLHFAIKKVIEKGNYHSEFVKDILSKRMLFKSFADQEQGYPFLEFDEREIQILKLIQQQKSSAAIGSILHLSKSSIDAIRLNLLKKTKCENSTGLILYCLENGILD